MKKTGITTMYCPVLRFVYSGDDTDDDDQDGVVDDKKKRREPYIKCIISVKDLR